MYYVPCLQKLGVFLRLPCKGMCTAHKRLFSLCRKMGWSGCDVNDEAGSKRHNRSPAATSSSKETGLHFFPPAKSASPSSGKLAAGEK